MKKKSLISIKAPFRTNKQDKKEKRNTMVINEETVWLRITENSLVRHEWKKNLDL